MRVRATIVLGAVLIAACAGTPGPGEPGYAYDVTGAYTGRLTVEGEPFDATLELRTGRGGRVLGSFEVSAPLEIDGRVDGTLIDDLLRVRLTYESADAGSGSAPCESRIEGILTVSGRGAVVDGPVTIDDCGDSLPGRMSFRRAPGP